MSAQFFTQATPEISVEELEKRLQSDAKISTQFIDVREPEEIAIAQIPEFSNYPLSQYGEWSEQILVQLDLEKETLVMCHHGVRSAQMCQWLMRQGFTDVKNVVGGIDAYSMFVDPTVPRY